MTWCGNVKGIVDYSDPKGNQPTPSATRDCIVLAPQIHAHSHIYTMDICIHCMNGWWWFNTPLSNMPKKPFSCNLLHGFHSLSPIKLNAITLRIILPSSICVPWNQSIAVVPLKSVTWNTVPLMVKNNHFCHCCILNLVAFIRCMYYNSIWLAM